MVVFYPFKFFFEFLSIFFERNLRNIFLFQATLDINYIIVPWFYDVNNVKVISEDFDFLEPYMFNRHQHHSNRICHATYKGILHCLIIIPRNWSAVKPLYFFVHTPSRSFSVCVPTFFRAIKVIPLCFSFICVSLSFQFIIPFSSVPSSISSSIIIGDGSS